MRLIFQKHMTDLVRIFGYETLSQEEARVCVTPLIEKYGRDRLADAAAEIVEEVTDLPKHYRLTGEARRLSVQILGREKRERSQLELDHLRDRTKEPDVRRLVHTMPARVFTGFVNDSP